MNLPRSEGTQRTGIGESLPGAPPAIGASAPADPPRELSDCSHCGGPIEARRDRRGVFAFWLHLTNDVFYAGRQMDHDAEAPALDPEPDPSGVLALAAREGLEVVR